MTAIRLDTDELKRISQRWVTDVSDPLEAIRRRVEAMIENVGYGRARDDAFAVIAAQILRRASESFPQPLNHLETTRERMNLAVKYFEEMDNASVGRQASLRGDLPNWVWNRDFAMCLMMDMTREEMERFSPYGNLLGDGSPSNPRLFLGLLQQGLTQEFLREITDLVPGQPDSLRLWDFLESSDLEPVSDLAELYLSVRNPAEIPPGSSEEDFYVRCVEETYAVKFDGDWPPGLRLLAACGIKDVAAKLGNELETSGLQAFREVYATGPEDHLFIVWGTQTPEAARSEGKNIGGVGTAISVGGYTTSSHLVNFATISNLSTAWQVNHYSVEEPDKWSSLFLIGRNTMVHELGHAFCNLWIMPVENDNGRIAYQWLPEKPDAELGGEDPALRTLLMSDEGFCGHTPESRFFTAWRQHPLNPDEAPNLYGEAFADMFLGWTYDTWEEPGPLDPNGVGVLRREYMNSHMPEWLGEARLLPQ